MAIDPFAASNDEAQTDTPADNTVFVPVDESDARYSTLILKGGAGYGAPSVSIRGRDANDLYDHVKENEKAIQELLKLAASLGRGFSILVDGDKPSGGRPASGGNSGGGSRPEPKPGDPECPAGWTYKTGSKNGKTWRAYMPPQGSGESPMWLK